MSETLELSDEILIEDCADIVERLRQFFIAQGTERLTAMTEQSVRAAISHLELARIEFARANIFRMRGM